MQQEVYRQAEVVNDRISSQPEWDESNYSKELVVHSVAMTEVLRQARQYAQSAATILLLGESGTGKEMVARAIHDASPSNPRPYVRVNCAAIPEALLESELFGHEEGAFTGALRGRAGRFEYASGGTLLLDEIGEVPLNLQAKLLRVLEENEYQRLGSNKSQKSDVRIIASTNRCLDDAVNQGQFRADLYYRINVLQLTLPPLRQRIEDIPKLITHFIRLFGLEGPRPVRGTTKRALDVLVRYSWPGNIRQLRNVIHRACVVCTSEQIDVDDLPPLRLNRCSESEHLTDMTLEDVERHLIAFSLRRFNGNRTAAARHLGVTTRTLRNKMKRYEQQGYSAIACDRGASDSAVIVTKEPVLPGTV